MSIAGVRAAVQYIDRFAFCTEFEIVIPEGTSADRCICIIAAMKLKAGSAKVFVSWGDGIVVSSNVQKDGYVSYGMDSSPSACIHHYKAPGTYRVRISDDVTYLQYSAKFAAGSPAGDSLAFLHRVVAWGPSLLALGLDLTNLPSVNSPYATGTWGAFQDCVNLTSVVPKPGGFAAVGSSCFVNTGLASVPAVLSRSTKLGSLVFADTKITDLSEFPAYQVSDASIADPDYQATALFSSVPAPDVSTLPSGIAYLGIRWFSGSGVTDISGLPASVTHIDDECFKDCKSLRVMDLHNVTGLRYLGASCFQGCTSLGGPDSSGAYGSVVLPGGLETGFRLGKYCFADCTSLKTTRGILVYPSYSTLGVGVFSGCTSLEEAYCVQWTLPGSIPADMFNGCTSLANVDVVTQNTFVTAWGSGCFQNIAATSVTIPSNVRDIACNVFGTYSMSGSSIGTSSNTHLETINVQPRSLTAIADWGSAYRSHNSTPKRYTVDNGKTYTSWSRGGAPWGASLGTSLGNNSLVTKVVCSDATVTGSYFAMVDLLKKRGTSNEYPIFDC